MDMTYMRRSAARPGKTGAERPHGPNVSELAAGAAPTAEQMGSRVDLPGEIREKMESSFGADFSNVKLYESRTVADAGAEAVTQGNNIAFAPGKLDLTSTAGQALLGHELSHVVSQSRGESAGRGFLNDAHLEAQADRQGMMAAQGESVYSGPVSPVGVSSTASAAGPMQAKKESTANAEKEAALEGKQLPGYMHPIQRGKAKKEYLDKRNNRKKMADLASKSLAQSKATLKDAKGVYEAEASEFMANNGMAGKDYESGISAKYDPNRVSRYMQTGMVGRSKEERQAMLKAFSEDGDEEDVLRFLVQDIKKYGNIRKDDALSENDEDLINAYANYSLNGSHQGIIMDVLKSRDFDMSKLVGEGEDRLTQEELDGFLNNQYSRDLVAAGNTANALVMMGDDRNYNAGKMLYDAMTNEYRRARRAGQTPKF